VSLAIVLVNYNTLNLLQECLTHLDHLAGSPATHIVIVDNDSTDGSRQWLQALDREQYCVVLSDHNLGFAGGCNLGIQQTSANYILLLNTDAFLEPGALKLLVTYLDQHPQAGIAGPQLLYPNGHWQRSTGLIPSPKSAMLDALGFTSMVNFTASALWKLTGSRWQPRSVEYVDGACMLIRRVTIDQVGGLDEQFFFFVEDAEFCFRARQYGWKVMYIPQSRVVHLRGGSSSRKNLEQSLKMRVQSERTFVHQTYGAKAEQSFLFWRRLNYCWRMGLASLTGNRERYQRYRTAWQVYDGAYL
jgi:GT2 family glycosyltransferase